MSDRTADGRTRVVELTRERIVLRRAVRGIKMAISLPVSAYLGVALRMDPPNGSTPAALSVVLEHRDAALSLPLYHTEDSTDIVAEWQSWARVLRLPLLIVEADGGLREPFLRLGAVRIAAPIRRRRRRSPLGRRRPSILMRRRIGGSLANAPVYRGEREIIARN